MRCSSAGVTSRQEVRSLHSLALASLADKLTLRVDFSKKVKVPEQDVSLRNTLQSAQYLEPTLRAKEGKPVSNALLDPPVLLITDGGHDVSRD